MQSPTKMNSNNTVNKKNTYSNSYRYRARIVVESQREKEKGRVCREIDSACKDSERECVCKEIECV